MELKIFIEERPHYAQSRLYVADERYFYTLNPDGFVVQNPIPEIPLTNDGQHFLQGQSHFIHAFAEAMIKHYESKGILSSDQFHKGEINRYDNEVQFLRDLVTHQFKKA